MPLLGQGVTGVPIDYSGWAESAWKLANARAGAIDSVLGSVVGLVEDRKAKKDTIKVSSELLDAYAKLNPESAAPLTGYLDKLKDEEIPLSERAALGEQLGSLIAMDQDRQKRDTQISQFAQQYALDAQQSNLNAEAGRFELDTAKEDRGIAKQNLADNEEVRSMVAPNLLENVINQTKAMEAAGQQVMIPSAQLQQVLQTGTTQQKIGMASNAMSFFPQEAPAEFRDIKVTRNGQPETVTAAYNRKLGTWDIVPVREAGSVTGLPPALATYAADFEAAGAKAGVDPRLLAAIAMHETGNGTSKAFREKNNAMGISNSKGPTAQASVPASIEKMAGLLGSTTSGPYKNADTIPEIASIYAPIGAGNDPRGLNKNWVEGVAKYYKELGGDPSAPVKLRAGGATSSTAPKTEAELQKEQLEIQKLKGDVATREVEVAKQEDAKNTAKASAEDTLVLIGKLRKHPGFKDLFGVSIVPDWVPATDKKGARAIKNQLGGQTFSTIIQQMRGLGAMSDAEGKAMREAAARLDEGQSEKDVLDALSDLEKQVREKLSRLGGETQANPAADYSSRLRSLK